MIDYSHQGKIKKKHSQYFKKKSKCKNQYISSKSKSIFFFPSFPHPFTSHYHISIHLPFPFIPFHCLTSQHRTSLPHDLHTPPKTHTHTHTHTHIHSSSPCFCNSSHQHPHQHPIFSGIMLLPFLPITPIITVVAVPFSLPNHVCQ